MVRNAAHLILEESPTHDHLQALSNPPNVKRKPAVAPSSVSLGSGQLLGFPPNYFGPDFAEAMLLHEPIAANNELIRRASPNLSQAPSAVITRRQNVNWRDLNFPPNFENRTNGTPAALGAQNHADLYWGALHVLGLGKDDENSASMSPCQNSQTRYIEGLPYPAEQSSFYGQTGAPIPEPSSAASAPVPVEQGGFASAALSHCTPKMTCMSSSSESSDSVAPTPSSQSDTSAPSDEGADEIGIEEQESRENNPGPVGPCSKEWHVPPRIRRKRQPKTPTIPKTQSRKSEGYHRRGPFKEDWKRRNTALTRKLKCCIRCRMMRIRCEPDDQNLDGDCGTCQRAQKSKVPIMCRLPCLRWKITDVSLYREQDMPCQLFSKRWQSMELVDITDWASDTVKVIELSQIDVGAPYQVEVREFVPVAGDMLESVWNSGNIVRRHRVPIYAISDMKKVAQTLVRFTYHYIPVYIHSTVGEADLLFWKTYYFAFHHQEKAKTTREKRLMSDCLRFWVACRKISHSERIYSPETLGGEAVDDPDSPYYNIVPIPAIMKAQMECIMYTTVLRPLKQQVLSELKALIMENRREHWLTIYLTLFILLHNCSMLTRRDWQTARQYRLKGEYANLTSIKEMQTGMMTMLAHFHYLNKGVLPFHLTYDDKDLRKLALAADLDSQQLELVKDTALMVNDPQKGK